MSYYDGKLKELQQKVARKNKLESILQELKQQRGELTDKVNLLKQTKLKEEADVDKLQGKSLATIFYTILGKKEEKLDKEKQEAYAAVVKYKVAVQELEAVEGEIRQFEAELKQLKNCELEYEQTLTEKKESIKASGAANAQEVFEVEGKISYLENQIKEIQEAISQGESAKQVADKVLAHLDDAEDMGTWDILGGGIFVDMMKHSSLDEAQNMVGHLQEKLRRFKTELADVKIDADFKVNLDDFTRFADYFFDGFFMDWAVLDEIRESKSQVEKTLWQIEHTLENLDGLMKKAEQEKGRMQDRLENLVLNTVL